MSYNLLERGATRNYLVDFLPSLPEKLLHRWWLTTAVYTTGLLLTFLPLSQTNWGQSYALRWLALAGLTAVGILLFLRRHLLDNHPPDQPQQIYPTLGLANRITLTRGLLLAFMAGFLFSPWPQGWLAWLPVLLYVVAVLLDLFDGYAARLTQHMTRLGVILDVELDGLGIGLTILLAVWYGQLPWWFLSLGVARFFFVWGSQIRERRGLPVRDLPPSDYRRYWAGFQMGFLTVALWPIAPASGVTLVGLVYLLPILVGFGRDWLVVSDQLDPANEWYQRVRGLVHVWFFGWGPLLARFGLAGLLMGQLILGGWVGPVAWESIWAEWGVMWPGVGLVWGGTTAVLLSLVLLGLAARWAALLLIFPLALPYLYQPTWLNLAPVLLVNFIVLAGAGYGSLYRPAESFLFQPLGSRADE